MLESYLQARGLVGNSPKQRSKSSPELNALFFESVQVGQRSEQFFRIVRQARHDGVADYKITLVMKKWDARNGGKYEGRVQQEVDRCLSKITHPPDDSVMTALNRMCAQHQAKLIFDAELADAVGTVDDCEATTLSDADDRRVEWRFQGLMVQGCRCLMTGKRKAGKTTLALSIASSYISGDPLLGRFQTTPNNRNIAVFNFDMPVGHLKTWFKDAGIAPERLVIFDRRNRASAFGPGTRLADNLRANDVGLLIVDNFSAAFDGADQNAAAGQWLRRLNDLVADAGVDEVILLAHHGHQGERVRGSSALEDWADCIIRVTEQEDTKVRFLSAFGRDVDVDEDQLIFDPDKRQLRLADLGSRSQLARANKVELLADSIMRIMADGQERQTGVIGEELAKAGVKFSKGADSKALKALSDSEKLVYSVGDKNSKHYKVSKKLMTTDVPLSGYPTRSQGDGGNRQ